MMRASVLKLVVAALAAGAGLLLDHAYPGSGWLFGWLSGSVYGLIAGWID